MFLATIFYGNNSACMSPIQANSGVSKGEYDTLEKAKKAVAATIANASYKGTFQAGYRAYIIDGDNHKIVSTIDVEPIALKWKDL